MNTSGFCQRALWKMTVQIRAWVWTTENHLKFPVRLEHQCLSFRHRRGRQRQSQLTRLCARLQLVWFDWFWLVFVSRLSTYYSRHIVGGIPKDDGLANNRTPSPLVSWGKRFGWWFPGPGLISYTTFHDRPQPFNTSRVSESGCLYISNVFSWFFVIATLIVLQEPEDSSEEEEEPKPKTVPLGKPTPKAAVEAVCTSAKCVTTDEY